VGSALPQEPVPVGLPLASLPATACRDHPLGAVTMSVIILLVLMCAFCAEVAWLCRR
jgi:hypothetical protein